MQSTNWTALKQFVDSRNLHIQYIDEGEGSNYLIYAFDGPLHLHCTVDHAEEGDKSADQLDFEANYKDTANLPFTDGSNRQVTRSAPFGATEGFTFNGQGIEGTASAGQTTDIDFTLTEENYINGMELFLKGQAYGDYLHFQVVDKDYTYAGILYPAEAEPGVPWSSVAPTGVPLNQFGTHWYVDPDVCNQDAIRIEYPARLLVGFTVRLQYTSVGTETVDLKCNLFLHKPST